MKTDPYWIEQSRPGQLAILPRPRGGDWLEDEVRAWRQAGLDIVVSLLTNDEIADFELAQESELCEAQGVQFLSFPIVDRGIPAARKAAVAFAKGLDQELMAGKRIGIHCRQGIGRSALIAACLLVLSGSDPESAFRRVSAVRGVSVPETAEQRMWVAEFARELAATVSAK